MPAKNIVTASSQPVRNNSQVIGRNFIFIGLEVVIVLLSVVSTTVFIARIIGPVRLGYFNLVMWLTTITCSVGSLGIPLTTFKYMGEFLGSGQKEIARAVFFYNLRAQTIIASVLASIGMIAVFTLQTPQHRLFSILLVLNIIPSMVTYVPSQANAAAEKCALNTRGAFVEAVIYVAGVGLSLLLRWDLVGIASGILLSRCVEFAVKTAPVLSSMAGVPRVPLPKEVRRKMFTFSGFSTGLALLQIVVWDRSDIIFLKLLQSDIRQLTFFSVCFSLADRLMQIPQSFANALSATQVASYGRDKNSLFNITSKAVTYVLMGALPILVGAACVGGPFIKVVFGPQYLPAVPVFILVVLFSIPKGITGPGQTLLFTMEDLAFILKWGCVAGLLDVLLDLALIPHHGATGAAWANGIAQTFAASATWSRVLRRYPVEVDTSVLLRLLKATAAMSVIVLAIGLMPLSALAKLGLSIPAGVIGFMIASRVFRLLQHEDRRRLLSFSTAAPAPVRVWVMHLIDFLVPQSPLADALIR